MNLKTIVPILLAVVLIMLPNHAAAQDNCYPHQAAYVSARMNIRQSHSTDSSVVRVAVAGESFSVSSSTRSGTYCWLYIPVGWMAWTARVSAGAPGGTADPSVKRTTLPPNIDNCCFVNRQCRTESEWTDGYWAYQRNECPAGGPTTRQVTAPPVTNSPAHENNCCFVGWYCNTDDDWDKGYWAYQNNQCGTGPAPSTGVRVGNIVIEGSESFQTWVKAGLDLLRRTAPQWYDYVQGATRTLIERPAGTYAFVDVAAAAHHTAWDANIIFPSDLNIYTIAHEMIHEACHIYQYQQGRPTSVLYLEKECLEVEIAAMPFFEPLDRWGRRAHNIWLAANLEHDRSLWWWGDIAECRRNTVNGVGC